MKVFLKPLSILLILVSVAGWASSALAQNLLPARYLPGDALVSPAYNSQYAPSIAQGGDKLLVAWADSRAIASGGTESETGRDIYAMRLDAAGNLLDATPIAVSSAAASQTNPKVAWNGSNWLVVFEGYGPNGTGYYQNSLYAVRVSPAGQVLDPKPIPFYGLNPSGGPYWGLASDGSNWVVAIQGTSTSGDIVALRVSNAGVVLDPPTRTLVSATYYMRSNIRLAYAGGVFLMTYNDQYLNGTYETRGLRFDSNLNLLGAPFQLLTVSASDLAGAGNQFYMTWNQQQPDFSMAVYGTRLDSNGQKLDGAGDNLSGNSFSSVFNNLAATWDGLNWRVTWSRDINEVRSARVNSAGSVLDPGGVVVAGPVAGITAGAGSGRVQMVWSPYVNSDQGVVTANINASNQAGPNREIAIGAPQQLRADIANSGNGYMLVYRSSTASGLRALAQPLNAAGDPLTAEPIELGAGDSVVGSGTPVVAWNGSVYLAAWGNSQGIMAQRLNPDGSKVDPAPFLVMSSAFGPPDVEALGSTFLVLGRKCGYSCQYISVYGARVNGGTGAVLDSTPLALGGGYVGRAPAVTTLGGRWLVVFHSNWTHDESNADTGAIFVGSDGSLSAGFGLYHFSTAGGNGVFRIGLASNGSVAMLVQSAEISSGVETDLLFRLIYPDGSLGPVTNLTPWRANQYNPQVAWDGTNFVLVYEEQKNRFGDLDMLDGTSDLFGMRISPSGTVIDPQGFAWSTNAAAETLPTVAAGNGVALLAGSLMRNEAPYANYRIGYTFFGSPGNQPPVAVANASPNAGDVPLVVNFSSAGSLDPNGSIAGYNWDFGDGAVSNAANPTHTYTTAGPFVATLTVSDNAGSQTSQAILVRAVAPNQAPVAVALATPSSGPSPLDVVFSASQSYDPDGPIGNIQWTFHDGSVYWGATAYYTYYSPGSYQATLTVYDANGATGTDTITINVGASNQAPVAVASATPSSGTAPLAVNFSSAGSNDPDGSISSYNWDFGDGIFSTQANPSHTYQNAGSYTAVLTVTDNSGATDSASVVITVNSSGCGSKCLRVTAISLSSRGRTTFTISGNVTVKDETGKAISGATVYATWKRPDGSQVTQQANTSLGGVAKFSTSGGKGTYTLTVTNIVKSGYTFDPANSLLSKSITR